MVAKKTTGPAGAVPETSAVAPGGEGGAEAAEAPAKKAAAKKATKKATKKAAGKAAERATGETPAQEAAAGKAVAKKSAAKSPAKKAAGKRAVAGSGDDASRAGSAGKASQTAEGDGRTDGTSTEKAASAKRAAAGEKAARKAAAAAQGAAEAAEQTGAKTVVAKKTASRATAATGKGAAAESAAPVATAPGELAVRPGEDPWTPDEVADARAELESEILRLRSELAVSEESLAGLMRDSGDGAGDDEADTGTKNITREHEMALAGVAHEMLEQTERALARLEAGTYGLCEVCGKPIGKARMQAFPRATLCVEDKQKQERRG